MSQTHIQADRQTDRQTDRPTSTNTQTHSDILRGLYGWPAHMEVISTACLPLKPLNGFNSGAELDQTQTKQTHECDCTRPTAHRSISEYTSATSRAQGERINDGDYNSSN